MYVIFLAIRYVTVLPWCVGTVLNGNDEAAGILASQAHGSVTLSRPDELCQLEGQEVEEADIGIWIDPIGSYLQEFHSLFILLLLLFIILLHL